MRLINIRLFVHDFYVGFNFRADYALRGLTITASATENVHDVNMYFMPVHADQPVYNKSVSKQVI